MENLKLNIVIAIGCTDRQITGLTPAKIQIEHGEIIQVPFGKMENVSRDEAKKKLANLIDIFFDEIQKDNYNNSNGNLSISK